MSDPSQPLRSRFGRAFGQSSALDRGAGASDVVQDRLAFFGRVGATIGIAIFVVMNVSRYIFDDMTVTECVTRRSNNGFVLSLAAFAASWMICRRPKRLHSTTLLGLDVLTVFLVTLGVTARAAAEVGAATAPFITILAVTNVILLRSVIIPSSAKRTLAIGITCAFPPAIHASTDTQFLITFLPGAETGFKLTMFWVWSSIGIVISTITSYVIWGLRKKVSAARQLGQYRIEEKLGEGGMGEVYRASHAMLRRPTAVKLIRHEATDDEGLERFEREVQATSGLAHPNTIAIYDYGRTPEGVFYYAMEYLEGTDLEELIKSDGPLPPGRVAYVMQQVCGSLSEAHEAGLIHRDIKPANIYLCPRGGRHDVVKVLDFGLVKDVGDTPDPQLTSVDTVTGTPLFMSPEGLRAPETVDARSDIYAVGAVAYHLVTGKFPFQADTFLDLCSEILHAEPKPPSSRGIPGVPSDLETLIMSCLARGADDRPQSARGLQEDFSHLACVSEWEEKDAHAWWLENHERFEREPVKESSEKTVATDLDTIVVDYVERSPDDSATGAEATP